MLASGTAASSRSANVVVEPRASRRGGAGVATALTRPPRRGRRRDRDRSAAGRTCTRRLRAGTLRRRRPSLRGGAPGIVTSTVSGVEPPDRPADLVERRRRRGTPWIRRRRNAAESSTNPITRAPGVSRSSRSRLLPLRPAPTMSVRSLVADRRTTLRIAWAAPRSQKRARPISSEQSRTSMRNVPRGKPFHGPRSPR